jgi:hypothetical protein
MRPLSFWQEREYLKNSGQAFLVRQGSLVFIEHFTIANDRSTYITDPHSHVSKLYFRDFFNTLVFVYDVGEWGYGIGERMCIVRHKGYVFSSDEKVTFL